MDVEAKVHEQTGATNHDSHSQSVYSCHSLKELSDPLPSSTA